MRHWLLYIFIIFSALSFQSNKPTKKWVIVSGSLKVEGSTNVNNFNCSISNYSKPDTIVVSGSGNVQMSGNIKLDVQSFDCHNPVMTADLRKTLKSKEHPKLMIFFVSMSKYPGAKQDITNGTVLIVLAGVSKRFDVDYKTVATEGNMINIVGSRKVNFSDFDLIPPRKLGGMIRTNNELSVVFNLKMKVIN